MYEEATHNTVELTPQEKQAVLKAFDVAVRQSNEIATVFGKVLFDVQVKLGIVDQGPPQDV